MSVIEWSGEEIERRCARVESVERIAAIVAEHFGVTRAELSGDDRHHRVALPRHVAMYLAKERLRLSFPALGRAFGYRDHTTVMSGVRKVRELRETDPRLAAEVATIEERLAS